MKSLYLFLISCMMLAAVKAAPSKCGGTLRNATGSFSTGAQNHSCTWYIVMSGNDSTETSVRLQAALGASSNVSVYAGNITDTKSKAKLIKQYAGKLHVDDMLISNEKITTIVYTGYSNKTKTADQITGSYSTEGCAWNINGPFAEFKSPEYLPGQGDISCDYTLTPWNDVTYSPVLSFNMVNLANGYLFVKPVGKNITGTLVDTTLPDDIILPTDKNITLKLSIKKGNVSQGFKAAFSRGDADCTHVLTFGTKVTTKVITLPDKIRYPLDCRIIVTSVKKTTMKVSMADLKLTGGDDSLTFQDGGSQNSPVLNRFDSTSATDYLFVTRGNKLWARIKLDETTKERNLAFIVLQQREGGRFSGKSGTVSLLPKHPVNMAVPFFYQVVVPAGQVRLNFTKAVMKSNTSKITVYDGSDTDPVLATIMSENDFFTITSSGSSVLIQAEKFAKDETFKATFDTAVAGCDKYSTGNNGQYKMTIGAAGKVCNWNIKSYVTTSGTLALDVKSVSLCPGSTLAVYDGITKTGKRVALLSSGMVMDKLPVIYVSNDHGVRMTLKTSGNCSGTTSNVIQAGYTFTAGACGGSLTALAGTVTSPLYPNQYPLNTDCKWSFTPGKMPLLFITIDQVQLGANHTLYLNKMFNLTKFTKQDIVLPFQANKSVSLDFDTRNPKAKGVGVDSVGQGFKLTYEQLNCGGYIFKKSSGVIKMPVLPANVTQQCVWIIKLKQTKKLGVVSLSINATNNTLGDILTIYDGGSTKAKKLNLTRHSKTKSMTGESRTDVVVVQYIHTFLLDKTKKGSKFNFSVNFKTLQCNKTCQNGLCLHPKWVCNGVNDCGDNSDELNCSNIPFTTPKPNPGPIIPAANTKGMVRSYVVAIVAILCLCLGVAFALAVPAIYKRWKYPNYRQLSDLNVTT